MPAARAQDSSRGNALAILAMAMVIAAAALIYWGRGQVMSGDDLFYAQRLSENPLGHVILHSNLYLIALPMVVYKAMFEVFGIGSYTEIGRADDDDLEALVLIHQDAELVDADFCDKVRSALSDPDVAIVGCAGAIGVRSIAWWSGSIRWASFTHRYPEFGGGERPARTWIPERIPSYAQRGAVDAIDGILMVMSPWEVRELCFDASLGQLHGYDFDMCLQARAAGKKVVDEDLRVIHHHSLHLLNDMDGWIAAHIRIAEKWDGRLANVPCADWRQRALRAEAEADASKLLAIAASEMREAKAQADARHITTLESSTSWRITAPLRSVGNVVRRLKRRRNGTPTQR